MTGDTLLLVQGIFEQIWRLFTSWTVPGTNVTPASWAFFLLAAVLGVRVIQRFLAVGLSDRGGGSDS